MDRSNESEWARGLECGQLVHRDKRIFKVRLCDENSYYWASFFRAVNWKYAKVGAEAIVAYMIRVSRICFVQNNAGVACGEQY